MNKVEFNLNVSYDNDLARIFFEDFKDEIDRIGGLIFSSNRDGIEYVIIGDCSKPFYTKTALKAMKKDELLDLNDEYDVGLYDSYTKKEFIDELHEYITIGMHFTRHYENTTWHNLDCDYIAYGYCQGDAVKVLHLDNAEVEYSKEYITNLFFDSPVCARLTFLDQEIYLGEYMNNIYEYDKDEIINNFTNNYDGWYKLRLIEYLKENLPDHPDYD